MSHKLSFTDGTSIDVPNKELLIDCDDIFDTPITFGCRSGVCATCICRVHEGEENLPPKSDEEIDILSTFKGKEDCRLACQLYCTGDVKMEYIGK